MSKDNNPLLPLIQTLSTMKISKYVFFFPYALEKVSRRFGVKVLSPQEVFVLYSVQYLPADSLQVQIIRHAKRLSYPIGQSTISEAIKSLHSDGLIHVNDSRLSLSPLGREYLSALRRFLLNKRL